MEIFLVEFNLPTFDGEIGDLANKVFGDAFPYFQSGQMGAERGSLHVDLSAETPIFDIFAHNRVQFHEAISQPRLGRIGQKFMDGRQTMSS